MVVLKPTLLELSQLAVLAGWDSSPSLAVTHVFKDKLGVSDAVAAKLYGKLIDSGLVVQKFRPNFRNCGEYCFEFPPNH